MAEITLLQSSGIYTIRNQVSGRVYVGSAYQFGPRWRLHRSGLLAGRHHAVRLQRSWDKHGAGCFLFSVVEFIDKAKFLTLEGFKRFLVDREQFWIDELQAASKDRGFNSAPKAYSVLGIKRSEETKAKMRASQTPERRRAASIENKGKIISPEHRAAISVANTGAVRSEEQKLRHSIRMTGRTLTAEHKAKVAASGIGRKHTPERSAAMSIKGKARWAAMSPEQLKAVSDSLSGKKLSPESIAKMSATKKAKFKAARDAGQLQLPSFLDVINAP